MKQLHNAEDAIKEAIEGGYDNTYFYSDSPEKLGKNGLEPNIFENKMIETFTDPFFWQALGKARGWIGTQYRNEAKRWFDFRIMSWDETKFWKSLQ